MTEVDARFKDRCRRLLIELEHCLPRDAISVLPLTGGVASDIALVKTGNFTSCVKFALAQLKVAEAWQAPVHRNKAEYSWLLAASQIVPASVPKLYGRSDREGGFAMEYLSGDQVYLWKTALLAAQPDQGEAPKVGYALGQIHAASTTPNFNTAPFQNRDDFHALRLDPYLLFTSSRHPALAKQLHFLVERLYVSDRVLVHGDVSPKNILFRDKIPVILDAECATMGDASFDVAFCLNHLVLKALHLPQCRESLLGNVLQFWDAYASCVIWEDPTELEARVCELLPALMLARIDGKSPVEYLSDARRALTRRVSVSLIAAPKTTLADFVAALKLEFEGN